MDYRKLPIILGLLAVLFIAGCTSFIDKTKETASNLPKTLEVTPQQTVTEILDFCTNIDECKSVAIQNGLTPTEADTFVADITCGNNICTRQTIIKTIQP